MSEDEKNRQGRRDEEGSAKTPQAHHDLPADADRLLEELRKYQSELEMQSEELRSAQIELSDLNNQYVDLLDFSPVGYFSLDENSRILEANLSGAALLGRERSFLIEKHFLIWVSPDYYETYASYRNLVLRSGTKQTCELKLKRADGREFWAELHTIAAMNAGGTASQLRVSVIDISERKRARKEQEKSERLLRVIMDNAPVLISAKDKQGKYILANKEFAASVGLRPDEVIGKSVYEIFPVETADQIRRNDLATLDSDTLLDVEETIEHYGGVSHIYHTVKFPLYLEKKDAAGTCAICLEITEKKRAEEKLRESEKRFKSLTENLPDLVTRVDDKLRHIYASPILEKLTGIPHNRFIGKTNEELGMHRDLLKLWNEKLLHTLKTGEKSTVEFDFETPEGLRHFQSLIVPEYSGSDTPGSVLCVTRDLTERKKIERALQRKEQELEEKAQSLQEANTALKVLLTHRDEEKTALENSVQSSVRRLVVPYLKKLRQSGLKAHQSIYTDIISSHLQEITSTFTTRLSSPALGLTSRELEIADLIKQGLSNDEISDLLAISVNAVAFHRKNIRSKLGLKGRKANLRSYLHSLS